MTMLTAYSAVTAACVDLVDDLLGERLVLEDAEVEVEDLADLLAVLGGDVVAQAGQLDDGCRRSALPRRSISAGDLLGVDVPLGNDADPRRPARRPC